MSVPLTWMGILREMPAGKPELDDLATEEPVFLFARRRAAPKGASDKEGETDGHHTERNPGSHGMEPDHEGV
jgi:hypothetical protein